MVQPQMSPGETYEPRVERRSAEHDIRGVRYHVNEWGRRDDPLLFMLHGWGDCGASFQFLVDELSRDWFVVAPDWRGFGRSTHRAESYWFPDYVADLDRLLDIYQPQDAVRLLGHSMGANVAGLFAGIRPDRVAEFVNVEGFGLADSEPENAPATYRRWLEQSRTRPAYKTYRTLDELAARLLRRSPAMGPERARFVAGHWAETAADGTVRLRADPAHKLPNAVQYRRAEAEACWRRTTARVMLVLGRNTDFTADVLSWIDPDESAHPFRDAETRVIDDAGHMIHFEQPAALAAAAENFLR